MGVLAAAIIGVTVGDLRLPGLVAALMRATVTFATIGMVFLGAVILAQSISVLGLPQALLGQIAATGIPPLALVLVVVLFYIALGTVFDGLSMMIMTLPIVFPLFVGLGYDPVWLGVIITLLIEIGMLTPPVGMNLLVLVGLTEGKLRLGDAARAALPYWLVLLALIALLLAAPGLATWLPGAVMPRG
jgi:TRAP-type C4-dicarboxylate transport system permease large subunit